MSPSTLAVPDKGREKEAGGKGPHCCKGQERRPAQHKRSGARRPLCRRSGTGLASGKESDKLSGLGTTARARKQALGMSARWSGLLAVAAQRAIAASLLELPLAGECNLAGDAPELHEVLADVRWQLPVLGSRQGPR